MRAFIYTGGHICPEGITEHPKADDLRIAADSGWNNARLLGERIDVLIGDFDSIGAMPTDPGVEVRKYPPEKDLTDTQIAVEIALGKGADTIVLIGGLGGRLDHALSGLFILEDLYDRGIHASFTDGQNRAHFIRGSSYLVARSPFRYLSLIAADPVVKGVTIEGCKYPLKNAKLRRALQFAVSNEVTENAALVSCKKGGLFLIESRDV